MRKRSWLKPAAADCATGIIKLWILRILVPLGGHRHFIEAHGFTDDDLARALGLERWADPENSSFRANLVLDELRKLHRAAERQRRSAEVSPRLRANVDALGDLVGLDAASRSILTFAVMLRTENVLNDAADKLGGLTSLKAIEAVAGTLGLREADVRQALSSQRALARSGLLQLNRDDTASLKNKLNLVSEGFADLISSSEEEPITWLQGAVQPTSRGKLALSDYPHVARSLAVLSPYLKEAIAARRRGVNVLLYGVPGTGKNELVKALAGELGCELFEITSEDGDGDPVEGEIRLRAFRAAQYLFANRPVLLLFDEIEDVFNDGGGLFGRKSLGQMRKAWVNRMLEDNPVPAFWLTNSVHCLDPAFIRRFDLAIELPVPPKTRRKAIIEKACSGMLDEAAVDRLADCALITPAIVTRAASVVASVRALAPEDTGSAVELLIEGTLRAQGHVAPGLKAAGLPQTYDPDFINADVDLLAVAKGLARSGSGRLCLYGPPGTGKSAYGHFLSRMLDMPLLVRRAADLMSMWVGETEKNIARAFAEGGRENAILLIDEVDGFLQDRRGAQRSWEVTEVNEMLTEMDDFSGIFIATTNLMESIDQAALRRFDIKAKFGFLRREQAARLLGLYLGQEVPADVRADLADLANLTPGDFAVVARRRRLCAIDDPQAWLAALEAECALKDGARARIGFVC